MTCDEIIEELKVNASEKYKANVVKMGIPKEYSIGVSTAVVREIAKRAAFTLIASSVVHNKTITNDTLDDYLRIVQEYSDSEHEHIRKAISWALREIGKKDFAYKEKAILLAYELKESVNKNKIWIAKDALKELETLVKVEGKGRLIFQIPRWEANNR